MREEAIQIEREDDLHRLALELDEAGFCTCLPFKQNYNLLRKVLQCFDCEDGVPDRTWLKRALSEEKDDSLYDLFLCLLEKAGLTEHGGTISAGFLTSSGTVLLRLMEKYEADEVEPYFERL